MLYDVCRLPICTVLYVTPVFKRYYLFKVVVMMQPYEHTARISLSVLFCKCPFCAIILLLLERCCYVTDVILKHVLVL